MAPSGGGMTRSEANRTRDSHFLTSQQYVFTARRGAKPPTSPSMENKRWADGAGDGISVAWPAESGIKKGLPERIKPLLHHWLRRNRPCTAERPGHRILGNRNGKFVKPTMSAPVSDAVNALRKVKGDYRVSRVDHPAK